MPQVGRYSIGRGVVGGNAEECMAGKEPGTRRRECRGVAPCRGVGELCFIRISRNRAVETEGTSLRRSVVAG